MSDLYQRITDQVIAAIEAGVKKTGRPLWQGQGGASALPYNHKSGRAYSGVNVLVLWLAAQASGFGSAAWLTFKQAKDMGGVVRKGEHGTHIVYCEPLQREETNPTTGAPEERTVLLMRQFVVFNLDQIDGIERRDIERFPFQGIDAAEEVLRKSGARIVVGGAKAYYSPSLDEIHLPDRERFEVAEQFYGVACHEIVHWSGVKERLARDFSGRFGSEAYAFEELVAELGAAFICADLGLIPATMDDHAAYVENWLRVLKTDKKAIFTAASSASKAHGYIMAKVAAGQSEEVRQWVAEYCDECEKLYPDKYPDKSRLSETAA